MKVESVAVDTGDGGRSAAPDAIEPPGAVEHSDSPEAIETDLGEYGNGKIAGDKDTSDRTMNENVEN